MCSYVSCRQIHIYKGGEDEIENTIHQINKARLKCTLMSDFLESQHPGNDMESRSSSNLKEDRYEASR